MNVLYDHQAFSSFSFGGVSRIYIELLNAYANDPEMNITLSLRYSDNVYLNASAWGSSIRPFLQRTPYAGIAHFPASLARNFFVKQINNRRKRENISHSRYVVTQGAYDIFHPTYYEPYFLDIFPQKPFVVTVYDMIYELFPEYFPSSKNFLDGKLRVLRQASKIIAISETTKKDLIKVYNLSADKIDVVYLASSLNSGIVQHATAASARSIPERYLLYVGNRDLYKNFLFFIEAITPLLLDDKSLSVICAGGKDFSRAELKIFTQWGIEKKLHYRSIDDILLSSLYRHAEAFVFPSLYEGFGIPILEAFVCDCPVLISNTGSLPEITGDAAVQFDPRNRVSVRDAVKRVLSSMSLQGELREKGKKRAQLFSWERTARETKQIYKHVLHQS